MRFTRFSACISFADPTKMNKNHNPIQSNPNFANPEPQGDPHQMVASSLGAVYTIQSNPIHQAESQKKTSSCHGHGSAGRFTSQCKHTYLPIYLSAIWVHMPRFSQSPGKRNIFKLLIFSHITRNNLIQDNH